MANAAPSDKPGGGVSLQIALGWTDSHLHRFIAGSGVARSFYGRPDPEFADMGSETLNQKRYTVADLAPAAKRKFIYEYDFGDGWQSKARSGYRASGG